MLQLIRYPHIFLGQLTPYYWLDAPFVARRSLRVPDLKKRLCCVGLVYPVGARTHQGRPGSLAKSRISQRQALGTEKCNQARPSFRVTCFGAAPASAESLTALKLGR
jgi:hypothetical protein